MAEKRYRVGDGRVGVEVSGEAGDRGDHSKGKKGKRGAAPILPGWGCKHLLTTPPLPRPQNSDSLTNDSVFGWNNFSNLEIWAGNLGHVGLALEGRQQV